MCGVHSFALTFYTNYANIRLIVNKTNIMIKIFSKKLTFSPADPLGDGLREQIEAEQQDSEAIKLEEGLQDDAIDNYWSHVEQDIKADPEWFDFADAED